MSRAESIIKGMIEGNLQQGWELLDDEQWEMAKHHFREAIEQVDQLATVNAEEKQIKPSKNLTLDI